MMQFIHFDLSVMHCSILFLLVQQKKHSAYNLSFSLVTNTFRSTIIEISKNITKSKESGHYKELELLKKPKNKEKSGQQRFLLKVLKPRYVQNVPESKSFSDRKTLMTCNIAIWGSRNFANRTKFCVVSAVYQLCSPHET